MVFEVYWSSSLKVETRSKRGIGTRRRVTDKGKTPQNWHSFLETTATRLSFLTFWKIKIVKVCPSNTVIVTQEEGVVCNHSISLEGLTHSNHEKADTRIFLHSKHAAADGNKTIIIKASDTYVIAVSVLPILQDLGVEKLWVAFGQGQKRRFP